MKLHRLLFSYKSNLFLACRMCTNWRLLLFQNESIKCWSIVDQLIDLVQKNNSYVNRTLLANFNSILPPTHTHHIVFSGWEPLRLNCTGIMHQKHARISQSWAEEDITITPSSTASSKTSWFKGAILQPQVRWPWKQYSSFNPPFRYLI